MVKLLSTRRELKTKDKTNIVLLRYGCLEDQSKQIISVADVSRRLNINYWTVWRVLDRFKMHGPVVLGKCGPKKLRTPIGNAMLEQLLLTEKYLKKWGGLTLRMRARKIETVFGVRVDF